MSEQTHPERKRREQKGGDTRLDPLLRDEDERVRRADLEEAGECDEGGLTGARAADAAAERERHEEQAGERHPEARERERRQISQPDLDDAPRRPPDRAEKAVHSERAATEHGHEARS